MAEPVAYGLIGDPTLPHSLAASLADPALDRATLLPAGRRTFTDPGDDITEERSLEWAMPGLLYDPLMGGAKVSDMFAGVAPVDPGAMTKFMIDAPVVGGLLGAATGAAPKGAVLGANVFHGGPHRFAPEPDFPHGRPRLDKIGTGEGGQAYGYGFYSADAPGVAKSYRDDLQKGKAEVFEDGQLVNEIDDRTLDDARNVALNLVEHVQRFRPHLSQDKIIDDALKQGQDFIDAYSDPQEADIRSGWKAGRDWLLKNKDRITSKQSGALYKLDIPDADVAKYLDYDKPLSEQPKSVREALANMVSVSAADRKQITKEIKTLQARLNDPWVRRSGGAEMNNELRDEIQELKAVLLDDSLTGGEFYKEVVTGLGGRKAASEALRDIGIPGLKYFDADSRGGSKANRTRNYVTWDQDVLDRSKMLERDGVTLGANKAPTAALPGLLDDTASRMQRARDMGFDVDNPVYHGTPDVRPINEIGFATPRELLLKKPQRGPYFFSKDRPTAATYADDRRAFDYQNAEPEVIKAFIKQENPLVIDAKGATYDGIDADKIIKQFADSPDKETAAREVKKYAAIMNGKVNSDQLAALASRLGRDGVVIKNVRDTYEGKGKPTDVFMVLGAENIRRTTAKFDPAKADSADLLAANPATAALPSLLQDRSGNIDQRGVMSRTPRKPDEFPIFGLLGQRLYTATAPDGSI